MITKLNPVSSIVNQTVNKVTQASNNPVTPFSEILNNALNQVETDIKTANQLNTKVAVGDVQDLHQVMIATEKANIGLQLTVQMRNKIVEAYQEIMRMQV